MRKIFLNLITIILCLNVYSQSFEKFYATDLDDIVGDACQINNDHIVFAMNSGYYYPNTYQSTLFIMNINTGEYIDSTEIIFDFDGYSYTKTHLVTNLSDTSILILGQAKNNISGDYQLFISLFDFNLIQTFDTLVGDISKHDIFEGYLIENNRIVSVGIRDSGNEPTILVYITDILGNFINEMEYFNQGLLGSTIINIPGTDLYHLYRYWDTYHSFNIINKNSLETDTIIEYPLGFLPRNSIYGFDSTHYFVAGRQYDSYPGTLGDFLSFLKVSDNGTNIQQFNYEIDEGISYYTNNSFATNSSEIYLAGTYPCTWNPPFTFYPEQRYILLNKINGTGELIWQKFYKGSVHYVPYKVLATNDGGALIFSTKYDWNNPIPNQRDVHILKIDSAGYYTPLTGTKEEFEQMEKQILVYPNPVDNEVNFVFGFYNNLAITIFDLSGKQVFFKEFNHSPVIDLSFLKPGIYPYTITGKNGFLEEGKLIKK